MNRPGQGKRNFFVNAKESGKKNLFSWKLRATVSIFCATGVLIIKNYSKI
jgi:hypothetical protein